MLTEILQQRRRRIGHGLHILQRVPQLQGQRRILAQVSRCDCSVSSVDFNVLASRRIVGIRSSISGSTCVSTCRTSACASLAASCKSARARCSEPVSAAARRSSADCHQPTSCATLASWRAHSSLENALQVLGQGRSVDLLRNLRKELLHAIHHLLHIAGIVGISGGPPCSWARYTAGVSGESRAPRATARDQTLGAELGADTGGDVLLRR